MQRHHLGAVAEGLVGVGVHLQEQPPPDTAARARGATNSRWPPGLLPSPPACCTAWSKANAAST